MISWVTLACNKFTLKAINNGFLSKEFKQSKGVHQGCAFSGPGFICVAKVLAHQILQNNQIKGIQLPGGLTETLEQYVDDTSLFSEEDQTSVQEIVNVLETYEVNTGLKVNFEKSIIYHIGNTKKAKSKMLLSKKFKQGENELNVLGIIINVNDLNNIEKDNLDKLLNKAKATLATWQILQLSLQGKIQIVNSLVGSLFVYSMQIMPIMSKQTHSKIKKMLSDFIWNARKPKVKYETLSLSFEDGGCKLSDLLKRDQALKVQWVNRMYQNDAILSALAYFFLNTKMHNTLFWECNISPQDVQFFQIKNNFWKDVLWSWCDINFKTPEPQEIGHQILWYNSHIKIGGEILYNDTAYQHGIVYVQDLFHNGKLLSFEQICQLYQIQWNVMTYNSIVSAIPGNWKAIMKNEHIQQEDDTLFSYL